MFHAVIAGYGELLPHGRYPSGAMFLSVDPYKIDVNVHPTKTEVRLSEERLMHDLLYHAVKRTIRGTDGVTEANVNLEDVKRMTPAEAIRRAYNVVTPPSGQMPTQEEMRRLYDSPEKTTSKIVSAEKDFSQISEFTAPDDDSGMVYLGQLSGLYLLFKTTDKLLIIDQHTAHERILYEEILGNIQSGKPISQNLLFPINIELSPDIYPLYEEAKDILNASGFIAEPFGGSNVLVRAVPTSLSKKSPEKIFHELLNDIDNLRKAGEDLVKSVAQSMACRAAIMAGDRISESEAVTLYNNLKKVDNKHSCPHGRPIILKVTREELDARFGR
jgi:DNA mismatch repair protein MutL